MKATEKEQKQKRRINNHHHHPDHPDHPDQLRNYETGMAYAGLKTEQMFLLCHRVHKYCVKIIIFIITLHGIYTSGPENFMIVIIIIFFEQVSGLSKLLLVF